MGLEEGLAFELEGGFDFFEGEGVEEVLAGEPAFAGGFDAKDDVF